MGIISLKSKILYIIDKLTKFRRGISGAADSKSFSDIQRIADAYESRVRGLRTVPLASIVGSVGRYRDFDNRFKLKDHLPPERLQFIREAIRQGRPLPPVKLCQIRDEYYVEDGNHRIAAAKELGHDEILAHVVELIPSGNSIQDILYRQRAEFCDRTKLPSEINLTEPGQYDRLLDQITGHQASLESSGTAPVSLEDAARDWYRFIYRPLCDVIKRGGLLEHFPGRTIADLYTFVSVHLWEMRESRHYGIGIHRLIPPTMEDFRKRMSQTGEHDYPDMHRTVTAFVLLNIQPKRESKIVDKLFDLEEVREIHSIHGDVDLLIKVMLTRDLLSSDAEIISNFVQNKVRQLPGIISTKTLIPGFSRIKD
ncbi:MAG: Lrp/AsnC ligand binding domain-containing protein [Desulfoferrobacter sp.]